MSVRTDFLYPRHQQIRVVDALKGRVPVEHIDIDSDNGHDGFLTEPERQFFDLFCSVDGVGVKKALRAMVRPVKELAVLIEQQDAKALSALPGIGPATSERIIAKLRRKMPRFALMVDSGGPAGEPDSGSSQVVSETFDALVMLGHTEADARRLIDEVLATKKKFKDTESMLTAIYQKSV